MSGELPAVGGDADASPPGAETAEHTAMRRAGEALGLPLSPAQAAAMLAYLAMLRRWNTTFNLTAIRDPQAMVTGHLVDSLAACAAMRSVMAPLEAVQAIGQGERREQGVRSDQGRPAAEPRAPWRVLDVGSGGGLPGVVLAIMSPQWAVTCIDAVAKKAAFVRQVAGTLPLPNLRAVHSRVEQQRHEAFDLITARAFATLSDLVRLTEPLLAPGGLWAAMKGQVPRAEIEALPHHVEAFHVEQLAVPGLGAQRCLVWMRPRRDT